jgi:hypothetical protein
MRIQLAAAACRTGTPFASTPSILPLLSPSKLSLFFSTLKAKIHEKRPS